MNLFPLFQINGDKIESTVNNIKYLGVQIDPSLNWKEQINVAIGKISIGIGMLKYSKRYLSLQTIQWMYFSIVDSHFRYCCCVWGCAGDTILRKFAKAKKSGFSCRHKQSLRPNIVAINIKTRVINS